MSVSPRSSEPKDLVERWVFIHGMNSGEVIHSTARRVKSATPNENYRQPVESLTVSFSKMLVNQINGVDPSSGVGRTKKKRPRSSKSACVIRNNRPVTQIDHVEEWLQQRSAHYAWWRKSPGTTRVPRAARTSLGPAKPATTIKAHHQPKPTRCILWFQFTGNPQKRPDSGSPRSTRAHTIRIEQQPLGGANALVFAAELLIGEQFAVLSRRQPGFTFSLTFFIDGVRHARLSGCCENARNLHVPTRVGGPIGAFVLRSVQGGEPCQVCEKAPVADPQLFTVWPKGFHRHLNISQDSDEAQQEIPKRRNSAKRVQKLCNVSDSPDPERLPNETAKVSNDELTAVSSEDVTEEPSADTFVPESIEEVYDELDEARFAGQSVSIEDVINIISPSHTPVSIDI